MGNFCSIECTTCDYYMFFKEGVGMNYSRDIVFYGSFGDGSCSTDKKSFACSGELVEVTRNKAIKEPSVLYLVRDKRIRAKVKSLLKSGATPAGGDYRGYGHKLYTCPKCDTLSEGFAFQLEAREGNYEPDYRCEHCGELLSKTSFCSIELNDERIVSIVTHTDGTPCCCPECHSATLMREFAGYWD
jgi:hypothetical protein